MDVDFKGLLGIWIYVKVISHFKGEISEESFTSRFAVLHCV